ncbi:MAG TPA: hypothetical protein VGS20_07855 [Candidatus Acidoferrales bacterium]|nr:hypothetical protein [Candidatus Acidoferrales bacterium]
MKPRIGLRIRRISSKLALAFVLAPAFAQASPPAARPEQSSPAPSSAGQSAGEAGPQRALVAALEAACQQNAQDFSRYLSGRSARSLVALPAERQKTFLERFSLTTIAGRSRALLDAQGQTVVRCDTPAETVTFHLGPPQVDNNVAFDSVSVEGGQGEKVNFGLVRQPDGWRLFSLGLLVIDVPALIEQWEQAELTANEQTAAADLVGLEQAIKTYNGAFGMLPEKLGQLGPAPPGQVSPDRAQLVPEELASGLTDGYRFRYRIVAGQRGAPDAFELGAVPDHYGKTGRKSFFLDQNGKLHVADKQGAPATEQDPVFAPSQQDSSNHP